VLVPVTVYTDVEGGDTRIVLPVTPPGNQVYVDAPEAVSVETLPGQSTDGLADADMVGVGFTETVSIALVLQPLLAPPVTVYVVVTVGETEMVLRSENGDVHVYD
jgi:hypothetical protein